MGWHKLLQRQLMRLDLNADAPPSLEKWQELLARISKTYTDEDQERYLLERSMEISSREMSDLNQKLEKAQQIARLGYWYYDRATGKIIWSKELYMLFGLDFGEAVPNFEKIMALIDEQDRIQLNEAVEKAFVEGTAYEMEIRMKGLNGKDDYRWYQIIGEPLPNEKGIHQLAGIMMDIDRKKRAEEELKILHDQLVESARRAGMADVSTSILHNVGNVLNSANVSVELIMEYLSQPYFTKFHAVGKMIEENLPNLADYLTNDQKGKLLPKYLVDLSTKLEESQKIVLDEVRNLNMHMKHIKEITSIQQALSGVSGVIEKIHLPEIMNSALKMCEQGLQTNHINIERDYDKNAYIMTDKAKLLQIVINLIQNAKDAIIEAKPATKAILLSIKQTPECFIIRVKDTGIGIRKEDLTKIFSFGFTTKEHGHGFGLHSSAIAATELGGKLEAVSDGLQQGATFILTLPLSISAKGKSNEAKRQLTHHSH